MPPLQTMRRCVGKYSRAKIAAVSPAWSVIAIGWEAHKTPAYIVPERTVIWVPHPTGAFGAFVQLWADGDLAPPTRVKLTAAHESTEPQTVWLGAITHGA